MWLELLREDGLEQEPEIVQTMYEEIMGRLRECTFDPTKIPNSRGAQDGFFVYPYLFRPLFNKIPLAQYRRVALVSRLYLSQVILFDQLLDHDRTPSPELWMAAQWLEQEATLHLVDLFDGGSPYWEDHRRIWTSYYRAMLTEQRHSARLVPYPADEFYLVASGIYSAAKLITSALATLADRRDVLPSLHRSQDLGSLCDQVADDLDDWREDFASRRFSHFVTKTLDQFPAEQREAVTEQDLARMLFLEGVYEEHARWGMTLADELVRTAGELGCRGWSWAATTRRQKLEARFNAMSKMRRQLLEATAT